MAYFSVRLNKLSSAVQEIEQCTKVLDNMKESITLIERNCEINYSSFDIVRKAIKKIAEDIEKEQAQMSQIYSSLTRISSLYTSCENNIVGKKDAVVLSTPIPGDIAVSVGPVAQSSDPRHVDTGKSVAKAIIDVIGEMGGIGKYFAITETLAKLAIDGDGITAKDIGSLIKGSGKTIMQFMKDEDTFNFAKDFGLEKFKTLSTEASAGWWGRASTTFKDTFKDKFGIIKSEDGIKSVDGYKVAGWALTLVANGFSNYEEYSDKKISAERAVAETLMESVIDVGKGALITAGVAAGIAALGVSAPAIVVGGIAVATSAILDYGCKSLTGKSVTELTSDLILDAGSGLIDVGKNAASEIVKIADATKSKSQER